MVSDSFDPVHMCPMSLAVECVNCLQWTVEVMCSAKQGKTRPFGLNGSRENRNFPELACIPVPLPQRCKIRELWFKTNLKPDLFTFILAQLDI